MFPTVEAEDNFQVTSLKTKSSTCARDVQDSNQNTGTEKHHQTRELTVNMLIKELVFCIALALTTYGALHNSPTKISSHPQPARFFNSGSLVTDWYNGHLSKALAIINHVDISFVMYYAPWDAECQYVRDEFAKAAAVLSDRVHFSAINCWNPGSDCRLQHNKIPSWPIIMTYTVNSRGVLYKGPRDAHSMVNFLELIMNPMKRISVVEDLVNLLSVCEAVAVGYIPLAQSPKYYNVWYNVALKIRDFDTIGEVCFAAVTSEELATDLSVETVPTVRLMLWNETKAYNDGLEFNEVPLTQWILAHFTQPVARIVPMWKKAFSFEPYIDGNPLLILFTPMNPMYEQLPVYDLLREISMEYHNCDTSKNQWAMEILKLQHIQRLVYQQKDIIKLCHDYDLKRLSKKPTNRYFKKEVLLQHNKYPWYNATEKTQKNGLFGFLLQRSLTLSAAIDSGSDSDQSNIMFPLSLTEDCGPNVLPAEKNYYHDYEQCYTFEESLSHQQETPDYLETTMLPKDDDPLSAESLTNDHVSHYCKLMRFAYEFGPPIYPAKANGNITHIHGLACAKNFSLNMLAMDSIRNHHFAEALGIDITNMKDKTAIVILDHKHESQHLLNEEVSAKSVREFILNFTNNNLRRTLRTDIKDAVHTHQYKSDNKGEAYNDNTLQIVDLTTRTFRKFVRRPGVVSIVCVCAGQCGAAWTRSALAAARLLRSGGVRAQVARLDVLKHDLPWHFTPHAHPTVLVFPADGRGEPESRAFPGGERVTAGGVAALALRSLLPPLHLQVRLALCRQAQTSHAKRTCLRELRQHVAGLIGRNLKYWRKFDERIVRDALLQRLQNLHRVSFDLDLFYAPDLSVEGAKQSALIDSLSNLSRSWTIDVAVRRRNISDVPSTKSL